MLYFRYQFTNIHLHLVQQ